MQLRVKPHLKDVWSSSVFSVFVAGLGAVMSFPLTHKKKEEEIAWQETGWLSVAVGSQPMKVVEGGGEGPVKQVCNLCVT